MDVRLFGISRVGLLGRDMLVSPFPGTDDISMVGALWFQVGDGANSSHLNVSSQMADVLRRSVTVLLHSLGF